MSKSQFHNRQDAEGVLRSSHGRVMTVTFIKKNGEIRRMNCRTGVHKGVTGKGKSFDPKAHRLLTVFDMQKNNFRHVNLATVLEAVVDGERHVFHGL